MPSNLGWEITPGDEAILRRERAMGNNTPRLDERCQSRGHRRDEHDWGLGESCSVCHIPNGCKPGVMIGTSE